MMPTSESVYPNPPRSTVMVGWTPMADVVAVESPGPVMSIFAPYPCLSSDVTYATVGSDEVHPDPQKHVDVPDHKIPARDPPWYCVLMA